MTDKVKAKYEITDTFKITGRGLAFGRRIVEGQISIGDTIEFPFENNFLCRKVTGIEGVRSADPENLTQDF